MTLPPSPYKGLIPYSEEDAPFFFGRERERDLIAANLLASRLTLLYGESGVGKSSVLHAGVARHLHELADQNLAEYGTPELAVVIFSSWRDDPLAALIERVQAAIAPALPGRTLEPVAPSRALAPALQQAADWVGGSLLIVLDQFEEYFLYHAAEDGAGTFAVEFPHALNRPELHVNFLVSMREDALAKLDRFKGRVPNLFDNYLRIRHLDREAARAAIEKPLGQYNRLWAPAGRQVEIEPALVEAVLEQVKTGQVALGRTGSDSAASPDDPTLAATQIETPYLQLVMNRLWYEEMRVGSSVLRLETLHHLGGAERIVRTHLDNAMQQLPRQQRDVAAGAFQFLVTASGSKIAHTAADLASFANVPPDRVEPVLQRLAASDIRLLRPVGGAAEAAATRYEIFHDVLGPGVLDWRRRHRARRRRRMTALAGALVGLLLLLVASIFLAVLLTSSNNRGTLVNIATATTCAGSVMVFVLLGFGVGWSIRAR